VRFLVDRCVSRHVARHLRERGHDVAETRDRGEDPGDAQVLAWAIDEGRVLVTLDKGFGELARRRRREHPCVVRLPDVPPGEQARLIAELLNRHREETFPGAVFIVTGDRIRLTRP
jgi:predicted nuclease of predicted toxin-antitoxin system